MRRCAAALRKAGHDLAREILGGPSSLNPFGAVAHRGGMGREEA